MKKLNKKLVNNYQDIWASYNKSGTLNEIRKVIKSHIQNYSYESDNMGNLFIGDFNKKLPCLVAHMDSVHSKKPKNIKIQNGVLNADNGIGGDDKCGIIAILEILKRNKNVNAILTVDEEIGGLGADGINKEILKNVLYFIEIDRYGKSDLINNSGSFEIASKEMTEAIYPYMKKYNFEKNDGTFTDINILTRKAKKCAINVSCGYYNAHTVKEYVVLKELQNTINFVKEILNNVQEKFEWKEEAIMYSEVDIESDIEKIIDEAIMEGADNSIIGLLYQAYDLGIYEARLIEENEKIIREYSNR